MIDAGSRLDASNTAKNSLSMFENFLLIRQHAISVVPLLSGVRAIVPKLCQLLGVGLGFIRKTAKRENFKPSQRV